MDGAEQHKNHENKFSLVSVMAAMLHDSVVVVVVRTRPRAIPLAMMTTKSLHGFPLSSHDAYGALPTALRARKLRYNWAQLAI